VSSQSSPARRASASPRSKDPRRTTRRP
jgi:hypothetical protein